MSVAGKPGKQSPAAATIGNAQQVFDPVAPLQVLTATKAMADDRNAVPLQDRCHPGFAGVAAAVAVGRSVPAVGRASTHGRAKKTTRRPANAGLQACSRSGRGNMETSRAVRAAAPLAQVQANASRSLQNLRSPRDKAGVSPLRPLFSMTWTSKTRHFFGEGLRSGASKR